MSDLMTFPNTVEEFMEQYKIIDTEQIYTNGAELVPIFRMKQWFEHLPTAGCEYWDTESNFCALYRPAAEPEKGKWIKGIGENGVNTSLYCDQCGYENEYWYKWKYCPNCGAKMEEANES